MGVKLLYFFSILEFFLRASAGLGTANKLLMTITCINVHLRHQIILTQPATPAIISFAAEHLYGVKLTSYFLTIPYQPFLTIAFLCFFTFLTGTFPFAVNTKTAEIPNAAIILNKQIDTFQCTAES